MTLKAEKLNKIIGGIPGICADGRAGIRALVEEITGERLSEPPPPPPSGRIGQRYRCDAFGVGNQYMITVVDDQVAAINLGSGYTATGGHKVKDYLHITHEELTRLLGSNTYMKL